VKFSTSDQTIDSTADVNFSTSNHTTDSTADIKFSTSKNTSTVDVKFSTSDQTIDSAADVNASTSKHTSTADVNVSTSNLTTNSAADDKVNTENQATDSTADIEVSTSNYTTDSKADVNVSTSNQTTDSAADVNVSTSTHAENKSTLKEDSKDIVWFNNEECKDESNEKCSEKCSDEKREHSNTIEEGNRKLDKLRKNQKNKNSAIPANFGFDFCDEVNTDQIKVEKEKTPSEDFSSKSSVKLPVHEPKHKRLQGSAILQKRKYKYRENLQGAQEKAEKIKEQIISGTKVVEITEKTLSNLPDPKTFSSEVKKSLPGSSRVSEAELDQQSVSSTSSSCSSNSSLNLKSSQSTTDKEKAVTNASSKSNRCLICGIYFRSVFSLKEHVKNKCKSTDFVKSMDYEFSSRFTCVKCGMTSSSAFDMKKHLTKSHNMIDDRDFEDLLISSYKCEMCGEMFKDKMAVYSHVSTSCSLLGSSRKKDLRSLADDKCSMQSVLNAVNQNHGKQTEHVVSSSVQLLTDRLESQASKTELQMHPKTVKLKSVTTNEKTKKNSENSKKTSQETVKNPNVASSHHSQRMDADSKKKITEPKTEVVMSESRNRGEPKVLNQRITRSKLEDNLSTKIGRNETKVSQPQSSLESKKSHINQESSLEKSSTKSRINQERSQEKSSKKSHLNQESSQEKLNKKSHINEEISPDKSSKKSQMNEESSQEKSSKKSQINQDSSLEKSSKKNQINQDSLQEKSSKKSQINQDSSLEKSSKKSQINQDSLQEKSSKKNHMNQESSLERSSRKSHINQEKLVEKKKAKKEDVSKKLNFEVSTVKTDIGPIHTSEKDPPAEQEKTIKDIDDEQLTPTAARRQSRARRSSPSNSAPKIEKRDVLTNLPNQSKSPAGQIRHTRSKGSVSKNALNDEKRVDSNWRKTRTSHQSRSSDISLPSECSEDLQKSSEKAKKKKSEEVAITDDGETRTEAIDTGQRKKKDPPSKQPSVEVPARGKRLIKVKKYDQYEVPDFLKSQVNSSNIKRQFRSQRVSGQVLGNSSLSSKSVIKKEARASIKNCSYCGRKFPSQAKLIKHIASVHLSPCKSQTSPQLGKCYYKCRYCRATYKTYIQYLNHVPGHATQILEGMESKQFVPAVVHVPSKPAVVKDTEDNTQPMSLGNESNAKKEKVLVKDVSLEQSIRATRKSESKLKQVKEDNQTPVSTRSKRSTTPGYDGQNERMNKKSKGNLHLKSEDDVKVDLKTESPSSERGKEERPNSVTEEHRSTRSSSRSARSISKSKEEKSEADVNTSIRQLRHKRESGTSEEAENKEKSEADVNTSTRQLRHKRESGTSEEAEENKEKSEADVNTSTRRLRHKRESGTSEEAEENKEKSEADVNTSTRQLRHKRESGTSEEAEENKFKKKQDTNNSRNAKLHVSLERLSPKASEHVTRSTSKRKSESSESFVSTKKSRTDLSDAKECEISESTKKSKPDLSDSKECETSKSTKKSRADLSDAKECEISESTKKSKPDLADSKECETSKSTKKSRADLSDAIEGKTRESTKKSRTDLSDAKECESSESTKKSRADLSNATERETSKSTKKSRADLSNATERETSKSTKKSRADLSDAMECDTSEIKVAESDTETFRRRTSRKRKAPENLEDNGSDIEEMDDEEYVPSDDGDTSDDSLAEVKKKLKGKNKTSCVDVQSKHNSSVSDSEKGSLERVRVTVVEDDEFEYVKSPTHESTSNETLKMSGQATSDQKERVLLSQSSKGTTAYLNSFMSYIDNQSKNNQKKNANIDDQSKNSTKKKDKKEKVRERNSSKRKKKTEKTSMLKKDDKVGDIRSTSEEIKVVGTPGSKKTERNTSMPRSDDKTRDIRSTSQEIKAVSSVTGQSKGPSFLDSFLEHCNKASDGLRISGAKSEKTTAGAAECVSEERSNDETSTAEHKQIHRSVLNSYYK
jgi:hypothetical protein